MKLKLIIPLLTLVVSASSIHAGLHQWSGGGANKLWSNPANWIGGAPSAGEAAPVELVFPIAGPKNPTNDIAGLTVDTLRMFGSGYTLRGIGGASLTLRGGQPTTVYCRGVNTIAGSLPVTLQGTSIIDVEGGTNVLTLSSVISGAGGLTKIGIGALIFASVNHNTYTGTTTVLRGPLRLGNASLMQSRIAIPGPLVIGESNPTNSPNVRLLAHHQIANSVPVTLNENGTLYLDGFDDTIGPLDMTGGTIYTDAGADTGTLTLNGDVTYHHSSVIVGGMAGHLSLGGATRTFNIVSGTLNLDKIEGGPGAGLIKTGAGQLGLGSPSTYDGLTTVNAGLLVVGHALALGDDLGATAHTIVNSSGRLMLNNGVTVAGETLHLNDGSQLSAAGTCGWQGSVVLSGEATVVCGSGVLCTVEGVISGTGSLHKGGFGTLRLAGPTPNTFTGGAFANHGTLQLAKFSGVTAIPGPLTVGDSGGGADSDQVVLDAHNQIANSAEIRINAAGLLDVKGWNESLGPITFHGGRLDSGGIGLHLLGSITVEPITNAVALIDGRIHLSGAGMVFNVVGAPITPDLKINAEIFGAVDRPFIKTGAGEIWFMNPANAYDGMTQVRQGTLGLQGGAQPGSTVSGTVVSNGAALFIANNTHVANEALTLHGSGPSVYALSGAFKTNSWGGPIRFSGQSAIQVFPTNSLFTLSGKLDGPQAFTKIGPGTLRLSGDVANNYIGTARVQEGVLELSKIVNGGAINAGGIIIGSTSGPPHSVVVRTLRDNQFAAHVPVMVHASGALDLNNHPQTVGSLAGEGQVYLAFSKLTLSHDTETTFSGILSGLTTNISLLKESGGRFFLTGTNTYTGQTVVNDGDLFVNGHQAGSDVMVRAGGSLHGSGRVGDISVQGGVLSPGNEGVFGPGLARLSCGMVALNASSGFAVDLAGTQPGTNYGQLNVTGTVNLGDARLSVNLAFASAVSNQFVVVKNDGNDAVIGSFQGLPEGGITNFSGAQFRISYGGGTGNDVVLTQLTMAPAPQLSGLTTLENGQIQITGIGVPGLLYAIEANADLNTTNWVNIGTATATAPNGTLTFVDPDAPSFTQRFYRFVAP